MWIHFRVGQVVTCLYAAAGLTVRGPPEGGRVSRQAARPWRGLMVTVPWLTPHRAPVTTYAWLPFASTSAVRTAYVNARPPRLLIVTVVATIVVPGRPVPSISVVTVPAPVFTPLTLTV
jgi:hypothetical protein